MNSSASLFNDNWSVYKKVISTGYMQHSVFNTYAADLISNFSTTESAFLDLGCGDAELIAGILKSNPIQFYKGYDLSGEALLLAEHSLKLNVKQFQLVNGFMQELIAQELQSFDIIHACFSIHHLADEEKEVLYQHIANRLNNGGLFIYIDVYRQQAQTVAEYAQDYCRWMNSSWHALTAAEKERIAAHIECFDFPSTTAFAEEKLMEAGLKKLMDDTSNQRHFIMVFQKP